MIWEGEGESCAPWRTGQTRRPSTARCALFPRPEGGGQGEGKRFRALGNPWRRISGLRNGKSSGRGGHQLLKFRFGLTAFNQRNRPFPAFNERPGFAGNQ